MLGKTFGLPFAAVLAFASLASAQTPPAPGAAPAAPAAPAPAAPAPAAAAPAAPAPKVQAQVFNDWVYRCQQAAEANKPEATQCEVSQQMVVKQNDKVVPIMVLSLSRAAAAPHGWVLNSLAPLGVALKPGLGVAVDAGKPTALTYSSCDARGCWIRNEPAAPLVAALRHGTQGHVILTMQDGHTVTVNFSLNGAEPALLALESGKPPVQP